MRVKELIEYLTLEDPEMRIVVDGYESGYDELETICFTKVTPNPKSEEKFWEGEFNEVVDNNTTSETVLYFPRKS